jgi:hypothetical protein
MSGFHNLDNEEVIFVYLANKLFLKKYDLLIEIGGIEDIVPINENTIINTFQPLDEEQMMEVLDGAHYKYCKAVDAKLEPIVEIIRETFPDLYDRVKKSFKNSEDL